MAGCGVTAMHITNSCLCYSHPFFLCQLLVGSFAEPFHPFIWHKLICKWAKCSSVSSACWATVWFVQGTGARLKDDALGGVGSSAGLGCSETIALGSGQLVSAPSSTWLVFMQAWRTFLDASLAILWKLQPTAGRMTPKSYLGWFGGGS